MGILNFGQWLKDLRYINLIQHSIPEDVGIFAFDLNGVIHTAAGEVYGYNPVATPEKLKQISSKTDEELKVEFLRKIVILMEESYRKVNPKEVLIVAVDGVAPLAKVNQQRIRRYRSAKQSEISRFDSNSITPGTEIMKEIDNFIKEWISINRQFLPEIVVYSSHEIPGEGEHKIFDLFRSYKLKTSDNAMVIHGLDNDLTVLSVLSGIDNIYLFKEDAKRGNSIVSIDALKSGLRIDLNIGGNQIFQDFNLLVFFSGNDFLPHLEAFHNVGKDINFLFILYQRIRKPLTDISGNIIWENFLLFLQEISKEEEKLISSLVFEPKKYPSKVHTKSIKNHKFNFELFKQTYYTHLFGPKTPLGVLYYEVNQLEFFEQKQITELVYQYLIGIQWVMNYYISGTDKVSNNFFFYENQGPLFSEMFIVLRYFLDRGLALPNIEMVQKKDIDFELLSSHQLLMVLPPKSFGLIPEPYRELVISGGELSYMTPTDYVIDLEGKDKEFLGIPLIPNVSINKIYEVVSKLEMKYKIRLPRKRPETLILTNVIKREEIQKIRVKFNRVDVKFPWEGKLM